MKDVMGIIYTSKDEYSLRELSSKRTVTAIPLAARYRLVDFLLLPRSPREVWSAGQ